jgi:hypothetical protein
LYHACAVPRVRTCFRDKLKSSLSHPLATGTPPRSSNQITTNECAAENPNRGRRAGRLPGPGSTSAPQLYMNAEVAARGGYIGRLEPAATSDTWPCSFLHTTAQLGIAFQTTRFFLMRKEDATRPIERVRLHTI